MVKGLFRLQRAAAMFVICALAMGVLLCSSGCYSSHTASKSSPSASVSATKNMQNYNTWKAPSVPKTPTYEDSRWPTRNSELLAIPESNRWYNAWGSAGTYCTVAGPVVNVYQATESNGMPIFIDIGAAYPSDESVSLVIWGDQYYDFEQMINDVDNGGAWISVTGYLSVYEGRLQFDAGDGYIEYTWWTHTN